METKRLLLAVILILLTAAVFAQNATVSEDSAVSQDNGSTENAAGSTDVGFAHTSEDATEEALQDAELPAEKRWQFLEWDEETPEFVLFYEVVIEEKNFGTGIWTEIRRNRTKDNTARIQVDPLLPPGTYRYKVFSYNMIGIADAESEWFEFTIYRAFLPKINSISSNVNMSPVLYLDEYNDGIFKIEGENLFTPDKSPTSFTEYELIDSAKKNAAVLVPQIVKADEEKARSLIIKFDMDTLDVGQYHFVATDASGLNSGKEKNSLVMVKFKKAVDFDLSGGYSCPVILYDGTIEQYMGSSVWPLSVYAKVSFIPFKHRYGYIGMGLSASYTRMGVKYSGYSVNGNLSNANAMFVFQFPVRIRTKTGSGHRHIMTLEAHGGAGVTSIFDLKFEFNNGIESDPLNSINLSFIAGGAVHFYTVGRLYAEVNVDFVHAFMSDMAFGMLVPSVGIGWQF